jgi:hypothetical protein
MTRPQSPQAEPRLRRTDAGHGTEARLAAMRAPLGGAFEIVDDETGESVGVFRDMLSARDAVIVRELRARVLRELGDGVRAELNAIGDAEVLRSWQATQARRA